MRRETVSHVVPHPHLSIGFVIFDLETSIWRSGAQCCSQRILSLFAPGVILRKTLELRNIEAQINDTDIA